MSTCSHGGFDGGNGAERQESEAGALEQAYKKERDACLLEVQTLKDMCRYMAADFENFKKRVEKERESWTSAAKAALVLDLLPVVDSFDRAQAENTRNGADDRLNSWIAGFDLVAKQLYKFLETHDVKPIEQLETFDPSLHEAVDHVSSPSHASGGIVNVVRKGFMLKDRVLRPARVTVAR